jgi:thiol-disulfide isomerase/thioredoxin
MKVSIYLLIFGIVGLLVVAAVLSTLVFNKNLSSKNIPLANLTNYGPAPNMQGIAYWINSPPLNLSELKGKVILVDFWTYSCINCIRTIPHLNAWESEYGSNGLVIIGVHTPEFQFEHNYTNVKNAAERFGIKYPVAMDNNYSTWDAYGNEYWPADYVIDKNGNIRYASLGEGNYNQTEAVIRELLENAGYAIPSESTNISSTVNFSGIGSPEMYFGYSEVAGHGSYFSSADALYPNRTVNYTRPNATLQNVIYLSGSWYDAPYSMVAVNNSRIFLIYKAKNVNIVASGNSSTIVVKLDGRNLSQSYLGSDMRLSNGEAIATINSSRLYNIVSAPSYNGWHTLEIDANPGFRIYTFTFG